MDNKRAVFLYWDGHQYMDETFGLSYSCPQKKAILVRSDISYNELMDKIYEKMRVDRSEYQLNLTGRLAVVRTGNQLTYNPFSIDDDESLEVFLHTTHSAVNFVELYVEKEGRLEGMPTM